MMRPRTSIALLAGVLLAGLVAVPGSPAGAQDSDLLDLPRLGFEVNPTVGVPGDLVEAQVDPDDIAEHCMSPDSVRDELARYLDTYILWADDILIESRPLPDGLTFDDIIELGGPIIQFLFVTQIGPEVLMQVWEAFHVLTFVDPATTEMVGETGGFDPVTGEGSIIVPDLEPSLYAVAAACVTIAPDEELLADNGLIDQSVVAAHEWVVENYPDGPPAFSFDPDSEYGIFLEGLARVWLPMITEPMAIGIDFYCILQPDGFCATPPSAVELLEQVTGEDAVAELDALADELGEPGAAGVEGDDLADAAGLVAVEAAPSFTG